MFDLSVLKDQKRFYIVRGDGARLYTPPDFIRHKVNKDLMGKLIDSMYEVGYIKAIIKFESDRLNRRKKH